MDKGPDTSRLYRDLQEYRFKNPDNVYSTLHKPRADGTHPTKERSIWDKKVLDEITLFQVYQEQQKYIDPSTQKTNLAALEQTLMQLDAVLDQAKAAIKATDVKLEAMITGDSLFFKHDIYPNFEVTLKLTKKGKLW